MLKLAARLPSAYQEVEWIQGSGTQYIDTGFTPTNGNYEVVLDMQLTALTPTNASIYGTEGGGVQAAQFHLCLTGKFANNYKWHDPLNASGSAKTFVFDTNRHFVIFQPQSSRVIWDGEEYYYTSPALTFATSGENHRIMWSGGSYAKTPMKLYACRIYSAGALISSFVPCYKTSDGVIGVYDVVKKVFKANAGTGTFTKGANTTSKVAGITIDGFNVPKLSNTTGVFFRQILGGGYAERRDYLESGGGTQFIKLGENGSATTTVELVTQFTGVSQSWTGVFGSCTDYGTNNGLMILYESDARKFRMSQGSQSTAINTGEKVKISCKYNTVTVTRESGSTFTVTSSPTPTQTYPAEMTLFKINSTNGDVNYHRIGQKRMYYCKIYNGSTLEKDLAPCRLLCALPPSKDSQNTARATGTVGMWDTIGNKFYANAGTGNFNDGTIYLVKNYIQSTGTQWINTGLYPTSSTKVELVASDISASGRKYPFGCYAGLASCYLYALDASSGSDLYFANIQGKGSTKTISGTATITMQNGVVKNGSTTLVSVTGYSTTMTCTRPLWLFNGSQDSCSYPCPMKVHSFKVYLDGTNLTLSFVPCVLLRNITVAEAFDAKTHSAGEVGMWDTVSNKFYPNIGTGTFTAG